MYYLLQPYISLQQTEIDVVMNQRIISIPISQIFALIFDF